MLGGKCNNCEDNDYEHIHFHHKNGTHISNGTFHNSGRGRDKRLWEWFTAFNNNDLILLCSNCHSLTNTYGRKKDSMIELSELKILLYEKYTREQLAERLNVEVLQVTRLLNGHSIMNIEQYKILVSLI